MLAIRRYLTARQSRETRGDYDALPLSDLGSGQSVSTPTNPRRYDQTPLTLRRGIITIISTIVAFTGVVFVFSLLVDDANLHSPATDIPSNYLLRIEANGGFYRDAYPIRSMLKYWNIAEKEVKERGLDTCNGQLGRELIDAHLRTTIDYCHSPDEQVGHPSSVICTAPHQDEFSRWWPHPIAPCISTNLRPILDTYTTYHAQSCDMTDAGHKLKSEMLDGDQKDRKFVGTDIMDGEAGECGVILNRTILEVPRQDQWNPFHVAEDLITTMVSVLVAAHLKPELVDSRVQLVFADQFGMDGNHFTPLWDRIGAWAPRRLVLDPWRDGECLGNTIHSINAAASLLSAVNVKHHYKCASTITWGASHYYRHLVGLLPRDPTSSYKPTINVLWLSRAKYDAWSQAHDQWTTWKEWRHVDNEAELLDRFRTGLAELSAEKAFTFQDGRDGLSDWHLGSQTNESRIVRFHTIDPSVHAIENQLYLIGHSTILVSPHSGALGLSLFLPPGHGHVIELQVPATIGWHHYDIMATQMGLRYDMIPIHRKVDIERVWGKVKKAVETAI